MCDCCDYYNHKTCRTLCKLQNYCICFAAPAENYSDYFDYCPYCCAGCWYSVQLHAI